MIECSRQQKVMRFFQEPDVPSNNLITNYLKMTLKFVFNSLLFCNTF